MHIDWERVAEVVFVFIAALSATLARVIFSHLETASSWPTDPDEVAVWKRRVWWALVGEIAAVITFVMVAEAIVIYRNWSSPVAVLIGAGAAVLGYPFMAGLFRRRVEQRFNGDRPDAS